MERRDLIAKRFLGVRSAYRPSFSPDGRELAFISDISGVPQVWAFRDGRLDQITPFSERVWDVNHSPTGRKLAFTMDKGGDERFQVYVMEDEEISRIPGTEGAICYLGPWSPDGKLLAFTSNTRDVMFFDLYVADPASSEVEMWMEGDSMCFAEDWVPHRDVVVVNRWESSLDNNLYLVGRNHVREILPHEDEVSFTSVRSDGQGGGLYMATNYGREFKGLAYYDLGKDKLYYLYEPGWDVELVEVSGDGQVAFTVNIDGYSRLYIYDSGGVEEIRTPRGYIRDVVWSNDGRLALALSTPKMPFNIYIVKAGRVRRRTNMPMMGIDPRRLASPRLYRYTSHDGLEVPTFAYVPRRGRPPFPTIVWVHGGPEAQARPYFIPLIQLLAYRGFAVLVPNVRGSTGYGKTYTHMDDIGRRMEALKDLRSLAEWAVERGLSREGLGIIGASYGGYSVLASLAFFPDLWSAGVDIVGIASLVTFLKNTGPWRRRIREKEYGSLDRDREVLEEFSPINHVRNIRAPLLIIHGKNDPRVPVTEALQIAEALKKLGRKVELMIFEDEGHGIARIRNRIRAYSKALEFFEEHMLLQER